MVVLNWIVAHWPLIAGSIVVAINEAFAWNPALKSNSIIQFLLAAVGMVKLPPPAGSQ